MKLIKPNKHLKKNVLLDFENSSKWFLTNYTINIYEGCFHKCLYCKTGYKSINDKVTPLKIINNLKKELDACEQTGVVETGYKNDPYNPFEGKIKITKKVNTLLLDHGFGLSVTTKSDLVTRDVNIFKDISQKSPMVVKMSLSTINESIRKKLEPTSHSVSRRLLAIEKLSKNNIYTGVVMGPILPFITDNIKEIEIFVKEVASRGAKFIYPLIGINLKTENRNWFFNEVLKAFPEKSIAGRYKMTYNFNDKCLPINEKELLKAFKNECEKHNILYNMDDIIKSINDPYEDKQLSFFG